jgi:hypothetical protein
MAYACFLSRVVTNNCLRCDQDEDTPLQPDELSRDACADSLLYNNDLGYSPS